jgi:serine/threonine protein kinase
VDRRGDIWAFGIVLMEMLTGRHVYSGETAAETLASVMKDEPRRESLPVETPPPIGRLLRGEPRRGDFQHGELHGDANAPSISGLSPSSYPASNTAQTMTINGSNFQSGATLTFHDPQNIVYAGRTTTFISSSQLQHSFNNGKDPGTWTVFVTNPDGQTSNIWSFSVY